MRIALVFTGCFRAAGVERVVWESARHLADTHDVTVLADYWEDPDPRVRHRKVSPWRRPWTLRDVTFERRAARAVADGGFDRVLSFGANCPAADLLWVNSVHRAWLERRRGEARGRARIAAAARSAHPRHLLLLALEARQFRGRRYGRVAAVSESVAADLERLYGVPSADVSIVPNGYSPEEFSPTRRTALRAEARAELGLPEDAVCLLTVANELPRKGFGVLLEAVGRADDGRLHVVLAGRAAPDAYAERIGALGLAGRVRYAGAVADVGRLHAAADLFVLPTRYEAFCLAIVEALASGLPVLTTDVPGAGDLIEPGRNGLLQRDPADAGELALLLRAGLDPAVRRAWSEAAPAAVAHLAWPRLLGRVEELLAAPPGTGDAAARAPSRSVQQVAS